MDESGKIVDQEKAEEIRIQIEAYLEGHGATSSYAEFEKKLGYIRDTFGEEGRTQAKLYYKTLNEEEKKYFDNIDFTKLEGTSKEDFDEAMFEAEAKSVGLTADAYELYIDQL